MTAEEKKWFNEGYPPDVVAQFPASRQDQLAKLKKGETVFVVGRVTGRKNSVGVPKGYVVEMEECEVVRNPKK